MINCLYCVEYYVYLMNCVYNLDKCCRDNFFIEPYITNGYVLSNLVCIINVLFQPISGIDLPSGITQKSYIKSPHHLLESP